jgi:DnaJ-domain-containing protein 1
MPAAPEAIREMTDNFALLDEPRRPWLDTEELKQKFLARSADVHPDRVHTAPEPVRKAAGERYAEINSAYNCLRGPRTRLRHLLELELGAAPADLERVPPATTDGLFELGQLCKEVDVFIGERERVRSPLLKVQLFERGQAWADKLFAEQRKLNARRDALFAELQGMNAAWESGSGPDARRTGLPLERLEQIYRSLGYLSRWSEQLQERIVQLSI